MCAHLRERTTFFVPNCISDEKLTIFPEGNKYRF